MVSVCGAEMKSQPSALKLVQRRRCALNAHARNSEFWLRINPSQNVPRRTFIGFSERGLPPITWATAPLH